jgi:hypothetical protein
VPGPTAFFDHRGDLQRAYRAGFDDVTGLPHRANDYEERDRCESHHSSEANFGSDITHRRVGPQLGSPHTRMD